MAVCEMHLNSRDSIGKMSSFMAILPEGKRGPFPVLYLLHGLSDNHTAWTRRTSIERYVEDLPLIIVMPNGERSFYTNALHLQSQNFETAIVRDLIQFVDSAFQTIPSRAGRTIAGLSMGGYGALKLALKHRDLFSAAVSHSGALDFASRPLSESDWLREFIPIFGENPRGSDNDIFALAEKMASDTQSSTRSQQPLALRLDCGVDDFLIEENRSLHAHLQKLGVAHEYEEHAGEHNWEYWDLHIRDTLAFLTRELKFNEARS